MLKRRFYSSLFFALALLFSQHGSALHALSHALAEQVQQHKKQTPSTHDCEQCFNYAQLGGTLNSAGLSFALHTSLSHALVQLHIVFTSLQLLTAAARGPPALPNPL